MPWANLDDHFHDNPKVLETPLAGVGLYAIGLSYCSAHMTDGFIPQAVVRGIRGWLGAARMLMDRNLWEAVEGGYRVHDYLQWNRSRAQVLADRAAAADRKRMSRRTPAGQNGHVTPDAEADVRPESHRTSGRSHTTPARDQSNPIQSGRPPAVPGSPETPLTAATGADGAAPRAVADSPVTLHHDGAECPICRLPYTGPYLEHTAAKHKVNQQATPGNLFGHRREPSEAPPPDVAAQFAAMHERLQSLPDEQKQA